MLILKKQKLEDFLFIDIETSYGDPNFSEESPMFDAWEYDQAKNMPEGYSTEELINSYYNTAPLQPEYGVIACITLGYIADGSLRVKTFYGEEKQMLEDLNDTLQVAVTNKTYLCGHAITMFDAPFIMRRCLINGVTVHPIFDVAHLKPWEVSYLDTRTLWKGTGIKSASLLALSSCLGIPSPKDDISGKDVPPLFWKGEIERIVTYCEKDVVVLARIIKKLRGESWEDLEVEVIKEVEKEPVGILEHLFEGGVYDSDCESIIQVTYNSLTPTEKSRAEDILLAIPTRAKGKATDITITEMKKLIKECQES